MQNQKKSPELWCDPKTKQKKQILVGICGPVCTQVTPAEHQVELHIGSKSTLPFIYL